MNAIGYARISTKDQSKYSLDGQASAIREYCTRNGLELLTVFRDNGEHSDTFDRADFIALENFIKKHKNVRYLIIMDHDRFSRDLAEALLKIRQFERKFRLKVLSVDEPLDLDINDPDVFLQRAFKYLMANQELLKIRKRTKRGIHDAMAEGRYVRPAPLGYRNGKDVNGKAMLVVDETTAPIVQRIFELYLSGLPFFLIAKEARSMGFRYTANGSIQRVLGNCVYAGLIKVPAFDKRPERYVKGLHQALVSESDFWRVQEMLGNKKLPRKAHPNEEVPLRGILKCWCGRQFTSCWSKGKKKSYLYYLCSKHRNVSLSAKKLHEQFDEILAHLSLREDQIQYIRKSAEHRMKDTLEHKRSQLSEKTKELAKIDEKIERLEEKMLNDEIETVTYKKWYAKYAEEKAAAEYELKQIQGGNEDRWNRLKTKLELLTNLRNLYEELPLDKKQILLNGVFDRGLVYEKGAYRTPRLHPALSHNELIMNEKGLLFVEQPSDIWRQIPLSSP